MRDQYEFYLPSSDGKSRLHCVHWPAKGPARALVQISHGMIEHILRYEEFAMALASRNIAVIGHDHLGHGYSCPQEALGFFAEDQGAECLVKDLHRVTVHGRRWYPEAPVFLLGHSMGSFIARRYLTLYGRELDGTIIMGTGDQALPLVVLGRLAADTAGLLRGPRYRSKLLHDLVLGRYNRFFQPSVTSHDWLSRDISAVQVYERDPLCKFCFTCSAYSDLFRILMDLKLGRQFRWIPRSLPVLILSGSDDPVGEFGRGVVRVHQRLKQEGLTDVSLKLYRDCRHELLNETVRTHVYDDIVSWIIART